MNTNSQHKIDYLLYLADTALILGQRLGEWCGHGPVLEQDIAMTNISLDYIGRSRLLYQYIATLSETETDEDRLAFLRDEREFKNVLLAEHPNVDFAYSVGRQFLLEAFHFPYYTALKNSADPQLAAIAEKTVKETAYHLKWSAEWVIRLGDGTSVSNQKMQTALDELWSYTGELFTPATYEQSMLEEQVAPDLSLIQNSWNQKVQQVLAEATLVQPQNQWMQSGGKTGIHTEAMGYILADMQYMQRSYPGLTW